MRKQILKRVCTFIFLLVIALGLVGCNKKQQTPDEESISTEATSFIDSVYQIGEVTIESKDQIKIAKLLYINLNSDDIQIASVIKAKKLLDEYSDEYDQIVEEYENDEERQIQMEKINRLIDAVNKLPDLVEIDKSHESAVTYALNIYKTVSYEYKQIELTKALYKVLSDAKEKIDELNSKDDYAHFKDLVENVNRPISVASLNEMSILTSTYESLTNAVKNMEGFSALEEEYKAIIQEYNDVVDSETIGEFLSKVEMLDVVTLNSLDTISDAISAYDMLSSVTKEKQEIVEARAKLDKAINEYKVLYDTNQETLLSKYLELGKELPSSEEVSRDDFFMLNELEEIYNGLSKTNKEKDEVIAIKEAYDVVKEKYDEYEFKQLVAPNFELVVVGENNPYIIIGNSENLYRSLIENMLETTLEKYNDYTKLLNDNHIIMKLHVYINGSNVEETSLDVNLEDLFGDASCFTYDNLVTILKGASASNENITSGLNYQFAISFDDGNGVYLPTYLSNVTSGIVVNWE